MTNRKHNHENIFFFDDETSTMFDEVITEKKEKLIEKSVEKSVEKKEKAIEKLFEKKESHEKIPNIKRISSFDSWIEEDLLENEQNRALQYS